MRKITWIMLIALVLSLINDYADLVPGIIPGGAMLWFDMITILALFFAFGFHPLIIIGLVEPLLLVWTTPLSALAIIPWYTAIFALLFLNIKIPFLTKKV